MVLQKMKISNNPLEQNNNNNIKFYNELGQNN